MDFKETCVGQLSQFFDAFILSLFGLVPVCILFFLCLMYGYAPPSPLFFSCRTLLCVACQHLVVLFFGLDPAFSVLFVFTCLYGYTFISHVHSFSLNPVIFGCICSYLFAQLHFPLSPSLLGPYLVGLICKSLFLLVFVGTLSSYASIFSSNF